MIKLTLKEAVAFEEVTGTSFSKASKQMMPRFCQEHRLEQGQCRACVAAKVPCPQHLNSWKACSECPGSDMPIRWAAAFGWILRLRTEPELEWETFIATADVADVMAELGNA